MKDQRIRAKDILALLNTQAFRCAYTGDELTPETLSADHKIPVSNGGTHRLENIVLTTKKVNAAKGTMSVSEFVCMCRKVAFRYADSSEVTEDSTEQRKDIEELSGTTDPVKILASLGYIAAAEAVRQDRERLRRLEKTKYGPGGGRLSFDEYTAERRQKIAELNSEIHHLQVRRSKLRAANGYQEAAG